MSIENGQEIKKFVMPKTAGYVVDGFRFASGPNPVVTVQFNTSGDSFISLSRHDNILLWDIESGNVINEFYRYTVHLNFVEVSPNGKMALSSTRDYIQIWDLENGRKIKELKEKYHSLSNNAVCFSPDSAKIGVGSYDRTIKLLDIESGRILKVFDGRDIKGFMIDAVEFSPCGRYILSSSYTSGFVSGRTIYTWDIESGEEVKELRTWESFYRSRINIDNLEITSSDDGTITIYDNSKVVRNPRPEIKPIDKPLDESFDKTRVEVLTDEDIQSIWDDIAASDYSMAYKYLTGHTKSVLSILYTSDKKHLISGSEDKTIKVWDIENGQEICAFSGHTDKVRRVILSPCEKKLLSYSEDKTLRLWDLENQKLIHVFSGHKHVILSAKFDSNGNYILSRDYDDVYKLWDAQSGREIKSFFRAETILTL